MIFDGGREILSPSLLLRKIQPPHQRGPNRCVRYCMCSLRDDPKEIMKTTGIKAVSLRDLYAPNRIFFRNTTSKKPRQASALPWLFILSCRKISRFGVLRSFEAKIISHRSIQRTKKYFVYFKDDGFSVGKKILSKPYQSLSEPA